MLSLKTEVKKKSTMDPYIKIQQLNTKKELEAQAEHTLVRARALGPRLSGKLRANGQTSRIKNGRRVSFGDSKVPYARIRHFENRKNPHTLNYLKRAGDITTKNGFIILKKEDKK